MVERKNKKTILLITLDYQQILSYIKKLNELDYVIIVANSITEALKIIKEKEIGLIIFDNTIYKSLESKNFTSGIIKKNEIPMLFLSESENDTILSKEEKQYGLLMKNSNMFWINESINLAFNLFESNSKRIKTERQLKTLLKTIPDPVWAKDINGVYLFCNKRFELFYGDTVENITGKTDYDFATKEIAEFFRSKDKIAIVNGKPSMNEETMTYKNDGHIEEVETIKTPMVDLDNKICGVLGIARDITKRKELEKRLIEEKEYSEEIINSLPGIYYQINLEGKLIKWNKALERASGYSSEELYQKPVTDLFDEKNTKLIHLHIRKALKKGYSEGEANLIPKNGKSSTVFYCTATRISLNNDYSILGMGLDVSSLKNARKALEESEKKFKRLYEDAPLGYQSLDIEGKIITINKAWIKMFGYTKSEVLGQSFFKFLTVESANRVPKIFLKLKETGEINETYKIKTKANEERMINLVGTISKDSLGNFIQTHCILKDITSQMESDRKFVESEKRFYDIFEQAQIGICNISLEGNFLILNKKFCEMLGYSIKELQNTATKNIVHPDDIASMLSEYELLISQKKEKLKLINRYVKKDGKIIILSSLSSVIKDSNNKSLYIMSTIEDITHVLKLEKEKMEMEAYLSNRQKLESIGTLAGGVAHEINNPINGIMNYGQLIYDESKQDSEIADYAKEIIDETKRVSIIVRNLLQFSRQSSQTHSKANIEDVINKTLSLIGSIIKNDQIEFNIELPENLPKINCRSQQIQQVLMNLFTNARDALNNKYKEYDKNKIMSLTCGVISKNGIEYIRLTIKDNGSGIPKEIQGKIFEPFFSTKSRDMGTGLGLAISYGIVKEHDGELTFDSKEGEYTKFYLDLPIIV